MPPYSPVPPSPSLCIFTPLIPFPILVVVVLVSPYPRVPFVPFYPPLPSFLPLSPSIPPFMPFLFMSHNLGAILESSYSVPHSLSFTSCIFPTLVTSLLPFMPFFFMPHKLGEGNGSVPPLISLFHPSSLYVYCSFSVSSLYAP